MPAAKRPPTATECAACGVAMTGPGKTVHCDDCRQDHLVCEACAAEVVSPDDGYRIAA